MMVVPRMVLATILVVAVAALPPCDDARRLSGSPCDPQIATPPPTAPPTARPTQGPTTTSAPQRLYVEPVCLSENNKLLPQHLDTLPGAFKPWVGYKYLKANGPFVKTVSKDLMGGQTLKVMNAGSPLHIANFTCVKEDNEWKARVKDASLLADMLTIKLFNGWCDVLKTKYAITGQALPMWCYQPVQKCLLQDISLYRSMDDMVGLRLDYGNCPVSQNEQLPGTKQATIMVGLRRVADTKETPNVRGFFEGLCLPSGDSPCSLPEQGTSLDLNKAQAPNENQTCFAATADMEDVSAMNKANSLPCFNDFTVYSLLDVNNRFPVLPVRDSDYSWLLSKLPVARKPQDSPCAINQAKAMYGEVTMDRVCVEFEGMQDVVCKNTCGKVCSMIPPFTATTTPGPTIPPAICIDCEMQEMIYAIIATFLVVMLSHYTYLSHSMKWVADWTFLPLPGKPSEDFESLESRNFPRHNSLNKELFIPAVIGMFFIPLAWSFIIYYVINLLDTLVCWLIGIEQCIRLWPFQYEFDEDHYMNTNGTRAQQGLQHLDQYESGLWIWAFPGPRRLIHVDWCPARLLGLVVATWLATWLLMCLWRGEQKIPIKKIRVVEETITETDGDLPFMGEGMNPVGGVAVGVGGMITKTLAFFGGGHVN